MSKPPGSSLGGQVPAHGGRVELRKVRSDESLVEYEVLLGERELQWRLNVSVEIASGKVQWLPSATAAPPATGEPPAWLNTFAEALLRGAWRARDTQPWPRRITRWRSAKDSD